MTNTEALEEIRRLATQDRVYLTGHARKQCRDRGASRQHVVHALTRAQDCKPGQKPERWEVWGPDLDGDRLDMAVSIQFDVIVITVFEQY